MHDHNQEHRSKPFRTARDDLETGLSLLDTDLESAKVYLNRAARDILNRDLQEIPCQ